MKHRHHLKPRHRGGTDADGIVEVSPTCHAMFHWCEYQLWGHEEDKCAWLGLSGAATKEEVIHMHLSNAGKKRWAQWDGITSEETRRKQSEAKKGKPSWNKGKSWSVESKKKMSEAKLGKRVLNKKGKEVVVDGVTYPSLMAAHKATGMSRETIAKRYLNNQKTAS